MKCIAKEAIDTAELKMISPLLDGMTLIECLNSGGGFACYLLQRDDSDEKFVLKHISVPESETNVDALILTGAVADREGARAYYRTVAESQAIEVRNWQKLAGHDNLSVFTGFQLEVREDDAIGYDFYLLAPYRTSLHKYMQENAITHLQALNLGIDLCNALGALRKAGYIHQDLKPENIFVNENGEFTIGDLGIASLEDLQFAALPEHYSNCYSAPELADIMANLNDTIDIYSVGMILYHLFNGKHAPFEEVGKTMFEADQMRLAGEPLPGPLYADYELTEILNKACAFKPEDRYQTPADFRQALVVYMQKNEISDAMIVAPMDTGDAVEPTEENLEIPADVEEPAAEAAETDVAESEDCPPAEAAEEANFEEADEAAMEEDAVPAAESEPEVSAEDTACTEEADEPVCEEAQGTEEVSEEVTSAEESAEEPEAEAEEPAEEVSDEAAEEPADDADSESESPAAEVTEEETVEEELTAESSVDDIIANINTIVEPLRQMPTKAAPVPVEEPEAAPEEPEAETETAQAEEYDPEAILPRRKAKKKQKEPKKAKKRKRRWVPILITVLVLLLLAAAGWFGWNHWYNVVLSDVTTQTAGDYIAVSYDLSVPNAELTADCKDTYGNSFTGEFNGNTVIFRDLTPGTQYYITFQTSMFQRLSGTTEVNATTADSVQIESLTASRGINSRTVNLTLVASGPEPEEWTLDYITEDGLSGIKTFTGHTATISDLQLNEIYTFTLRAPEDSTIVGQTSVSYEVIPEVLAEGIHISGLDEDTATLSWNSVGDEADSWHVTCTGTDYTQEVDAEECTATFTDIDPTAAYTFTLTARGLETPVSLTLDENSTVVTDFTAESNEEGIINVAWVCDSDKQPEAWLVEYTLAHNPDLTTTIKTAQPETTISQAIPGTDYIVQLLADDGRTLVGGTVVTLTTPEAEPFTDYGFQEDNVDLRFYPAPDTTEPTFADLADAAEEFTVGDGICLALAAPEDFEPKAEEDAADWLITIVIRDETGMIVDTFPLSSTWEKMWTDGNYVAVLPRTPEIAGNYQIELYFNNQYVAKSELSLLPAVTE